MNKLILLFLLAFITFKNVSAQKGCPYDFENGNNLVTNPDFEQGLVGFYSDYKKNTTKDWFQGSIYVTEKPSEVHNNYRLCLDSNFQNLGKMFVVDGAQDRNKIVWQQKINVEPNTEYYFSFFFATLLKPNPAQLEITINNVRLTKPFDYNYQHCRGSVYFCFWSSAMSKVADIKIRAYTTDLMGNDFALDNVQFFSCKKKKEPEVMPSLRKTKFDSTNFKIETSTKSNTGIVSKIQVRFEGDSVTQELLTDSTGIASIVLKKQDAFLKIQAENYFTLLDTIKGNDFYEDSIMIKTLTLSPLDSGTSFTLKNLTFERYSFTLDENSKQELLSIVELLNTNPNIHLAIQGHTDNQGDALKNYELSLERVKSVKSYLVEKGIADYRLKETGFGGTKPLVGYGTDEERKVNRRVEFVITKNK